MASLDTRQLVPGPVVASSYPPELQYMEYDQQLQPGGRYSTVSNGYEVLPEEVGVVEGVHGNGGGQLEPQRLAEGALASWRVGTANTVGGGSLASGLNLSTRSSDVDLKNLLLQRGNHPLEGLYKAAAQGDRSGIMHVMKLQGPGAPIDALDGNGCTPLMYAVMADSRLAVEMLLNFSAKRETVDLEGRTAVHYAAFFGKHRSLKFLIESASDWTPRDSYGRTPLHWACATSTTKCLAVLLKHASVVLGDINPMDSEGMTPLHCAAQYGHSRHITLLSEAEVDFSALDVEDKTALHWTATNQDTSSLQALVEAFPPLLNKRDSNGCTLLHLTATNGAAHLVDAILKIEGLELDAQDSQERTALHHACLEGHAKTVELLMDRGALDSCVDTQGLTALHYAVQRSHLSIIRVLVRYPGLTHLPQGEGRTPLMMAAIAKGDGLLQALQILLTKDTIAQSVNAVDSEGQSALHLASEANCPGCVESLLASGADPNLLNSALQTPLFAACVGGYTDCIQALVVGGGNPAVLDSEGQSPLHRATLHGQLGSVRSLALTGADLGLQDGDGNVAVQLAAYGGSEAVLAVLLEKGADPNTQNINGLAGLHLAAMEGHTGCVALLMRYRAFLNSMDHSENRLTPLDYARLHGHTECAQLLSQNGAVSSDGIHDMAARSIQACYRRYRLRMQRSELSVQSRAVTMIARYVRGYLQRGRYRLLLQRVQASTVIQAYIRGHLQRVKFRAQVARFREQARDKQLMEEFGRRFMQERATLQPLTFTQAEEAFAEQKSEEERLAEDMARRKEQKLRLETAMKMREILLEKQRRWEEFRQAERQRRIDKATQEELNRYTSIIKESQGRREFTQGKFQLSKTVRCCYDAAIVIQRAFRTMRARRQLQQEQEKWRVVLQAEQEKRAVVVIQRAWRKYQQYRLYQALHFKAIMTHPVIAMRRHPPPPPPAPLPLLPPSASSSHWGVHSYERGISITGNPRHKMHQTEQSGFTVFRPSTRDLLFKPAASSRHYPRSQIDGGRVDGTARDAHKLEHSTGGTGGSLLPRLVGHRPRDIDGGLTASLKPKSKAGLAVHLPEIVQSR